MKPRTIWASTMALAGAFLIAGSALAQTGGPADPTALSSSVRSALSGLPYYGVFDLLTYRAGSDGVVCLGGYVYQGSLVAAAERAVGAVEGVTRVENAIAPLPVSASDDDVRWRVYEAIYGDPFLSQYAPPGQEAASLRWTPWGLSYRSSSVFQEQRWKDSPYLGLEPVGKYAIHIVVAHGQVTLAGVVNNEADRDNVGNRAKAVIGATSVVNDLQVESGGEAR